MIIYGFECLDSTYQGIFTGTFGPYTPQNVPYVTAQGIAIVNTRVRLIAPSSFADNGWRISADHFLFWHNSFNKDFNFWNDGDVHGNRYPLNLTNLDVRGNHFSTLKAIAPLGDINGDIANAPGIDTRSWQYNHFEHDTDSHVHAETPGTDFTTGDAGIDENGKPLSGSILIDRLPSQLVPSDATGGFRDASPDIGAYEFSTGFCGNQVIDAGEICDTSQLNGQTCQTRGFGSGVLGRNAQCDGYDTANCN